jgi:hypothetical protein
LFPRLVQQIPLVHLSVHQLDHHLFVSPQQSCLEFSSAWRKLCLPNFYPELAAKFLALSIFNLLQLPPFWQTFCWSISFTFCQFLTPKLVCFAFIPKRLKVEYSKLS